MSPEESEDTALGAPWPDAGSVVQRTGLVVVHEGERIVPDPKSRAILRESGGERRPSVELVFPVEIEVSGGAADVDLDRLAELVLRRLTRGILGV